MSVSEAIVWAAAIIVLGPPALVLAVVLIALLAMFTIIACEWIWNLVRRKAH